MADVNENPANGVSSKEVLREFDRQNDSDEFACYTCIKMLPKEDFGHAQCRDKTFSRNGRKKTEKMTRICMACAVRTKFYRHLKPVRFQGVRQYHCHQCGHLGSAGARCRRIYEPYEDMPLLCLHHLVCYDPHRVPEFETLSPIESLDEDIMKKIVRFLEYRDAIELERTSREMAYIIEPTKMVPIHERYLLTNEKFSRQLQTPWTIPRYINFHTRAKLACFVCFRIRDSKHFSKKQIAMAQSNQRTYHHMRCSSCLDKLYVQGDQTLLAQYNSYRMCLRCKCLAAIDKRCENCVEWDATDKWIYGGPPFPIPKMPLPKLSDELKVFEAMIGSPPDPRREYHYLLPETFPLRKMPVLRSEKDFDEEAFMRKLLENQKKKKKKK